MWQVGDVRITKIIEFEMPPIEGPDFIFPDATAARMREIPWLTPAYVDDGRLKFSFHALVVETPTMVILVDTCFGNDKKRGIDMDKINTPFLHNLAAAGYPAERIDRVVCTHLHIDHVGWNTRLLEGRWVPTFPNARYLIAKTEYAHWSQQQHDAMHVQVFEDSVAPVWQAGLVDLVDLDHELCREVRLHPTPGHTAGHVSVAIDSGPQRAMITGDFVHHPFQLAHPDWSARIDHDPQLSTATRQSEFSRLADDNVLVIGTHFCDPTAGYVLRDQQVFRFSTCEPTRGMT